MLFNEIRWVRRTLVTKWEKASTGTHPSKRKVYHVSLHNFELSFKTIAVTTVDFVAKVFDISGYISNVSIATVSTATVC